MNKRNGLQSTFPFILGFVACFFLSDCTSIRSQRQTQPVFLYLCQGRRCWRRCLDLNRLVPIRQSLIREQRRVRAFVPELWQDLWQIQDIINLKVSKVGHHRIVCHVNSRPANIHGLVHIGGRVIHKVTVGRVHHSSIPHRPTERFRFWFAWEVGFHVVAVRQSVKQSFQSQNFDHSQSVLSFFKIEKLVIDRRGQYTSRKIRIRSQMR